MGGQHSSGGTTADMAVVCCLGGGVGTAIALVLAGLGWAAFCVALATVAAGSVRLAMLRHRTGRRELLAS